VGNAHGTAARINRVSSFYIAATEIKMDSRYIGQKNSRTEEPKDTRINNTNTYEKMALFCSVEKPDFFRPVGA
jgi:hypothetical protein